ncbi:MAG: hypothetical protein AVDCRST_MAG59-2723, partial [uncultured Thermomicrobiales bacterium]
WGCTNPTPRIAAWWRRSSSRERQSESSAEASPFLRIPCS